MTSEKGPLDAIARAITQIVSNEGVLESFKAVSLSTGTDAQARVTVYVVFGSQRIRSESIDVDTNLAFARAYLGAVNQYRAMLSQ